MTGLDELGRQIAREQNALLAQSRVRSDVRTRLETLELPEVKSRVWPLALGATGLAGALGGLLLVAAPWASEPGLKPLTVAIGEEGTPGSTGSWIEAPASGAIAMRFSDGTLVDVAPNSRARIAELRPTGAHLLLENGLAHFAVHHQPKASWRVSAGPFAVKVTGTDFDVRWTPEQDAFELDLHEGHVEISGCVFGQSYALNAGQRAVASCRRGQLRVGAAAEFATEAAAAAARPEPAELSAAAHAPAPELPPPAAIEQSPRDRSLAVRIARRRSAAAREAKNARQEHSQWRALAEAGHYAEAMALVQSAGFALECRRADAAGLILLSDLARYDRNYADAASALRQLRQRFAGSRYAAQAAFALGKLEFDQDGSYSEAAGWFRTYLKEQPKGALAREASGRLLEATLRSGDSASARELAAQYLRDYPSGPHAQLASGLRGDAR